MTLSGMTIGHLRLASNLLLAPMSGYTDLAFRLVVRGCGGVGLAYTDLLCPRGLLEGNRRSMELAGTCSRDRPLAMQLYGAEATVLCQAARWAEDHGADLVDINMGCPAERITAGNAGCALLRDPDAALHLVERIVRSVRRARVTVKMRLGWDQSSIVAPYLAPRLEQAGVAMIVVHGRTASMGYAGTCQLEEIARVVACVRRIPVVGNGDIRSVHDARRMLEVTGCAGVMIGRHALSAPWIFRDTWGFLRTGVIPPEPALAEKCELMRQHFQNLVRLRGERVAVVHFRQRITWYAKRMNPCRILRQSMRHITCQADFDRAIEQFLQWRRERDARARRGIAQEVQQAHPDRNAAGRERFS